MELLKLAKVFSTIAISLVVLHLIWPGLGIDAVTIALMLLAAAPWLLPHLKSMELPGGVKIELKDVKEATALVIEGAKATPVPAEVQREAKDLERQLEMLRGVGERDSNLMLVGFRIEVEKRLLELAATNGFYLPRVSLLRVIDTLKDNEILPPQVASGLSDLIMVGNRAAHGAQVVPEAAAWVLDVGIDVLRSLDALIVASRAKTPKEP